MAWEWDVTDTFAESHLSSIAAKQAADSTTVYQELEKKQLFPVATETARSWSQQDTELVQ